MVDTSGWSEERLGTLPAYTKVAKIIHWITAFMVLTMIPVGIAMANFKLGSWGNWAYDYHRGMGFFLLVLTVLRLGWRLTHKPAPLPSVIPPLQQMVAHILHWALYAIIICNALLGWIATNYWGVKNIPIFGLFDLPMLVAKDRPVSDWLFPIHEYLGIAMAVLVLVHIGAALMHHFVKKDGTLLRMIR